MVVETYSITLHLKGTMQFLFLNDQYDINTGKGNGYGETQQRSTKGDGRGRKSQKVREQSIP